MTYLVHMQYFHISQPYYGYVKLGGQVPFGKVFELRSSGSRFVRGTSVDDVVVLWTEASATTRVCYRIRIMHRIWFRDIFEAFDYCGVSRLLPDLSVKNGCSDISDVTKYLVYIAECSIQRLRAMLVYSKFGTSVVAGLYEKGRCLDGGVVATRVEVVSYEWIEAM